MSIRATSQGPARLWELLLLVGLSSVALALLRMLSRSAPNAGPLLAILACVNLPFLIVAQVKLWRRPVREFAGLRRHLMIALWAGIMAEVAAIVMAWLG